MKFLREIPRYLHFIGIGGAGMSSIARFLLLRGFKVSGSDLNYNEECKKLENLGALIFKDQSKSNLQNVGLVIVSSAIKDSNEELIEARKLGITILKRAQMLFELMRYKKSIAVCGTHGKSTSTAMLYHIYQSLTLDPSVVNGANILGYNYSSNYGKGESFIFEADESDGSFSFYHPYRILLTNMEADHLENYNNEFSKMVDSYINFINQSPYYNKVIINSDIENYQNIVSRLNSKVISFGFSKDATYYIS
ncbi:MAG: Mur ligase domain-containing protein, partial [Psittacicella sp.]